MKNLFYIMLGRLPEQPEKSTHNIWANSDREIMCENENQANMIADFLEALGMDICTSYYEDDDSDYYGWWAVYPNE